MVSHIHSRRTTETDAVLAGASRLGPPHKAYPGERELRSGLWLCAACVILIGVWRGMRLVSTADRVDLSGTYGYGEVRPHFSADHL